VVGSAVAIATGGLCVVATGAARPWDGGASAAKAVFERRGFQFA
jgi:hypothetical protein